MRAPSIDSLQKYLNLNNLEAHAVRDLCRSVDSPTDRQMFSVWLEEYAPNILAAAKEEVPSPLEYNTSRLRLMMEALSIRLRGKGRATLVTKSGNVVYVDLGDSNKNTLLYVVGKGALLIGKPSSYR